MIRQTFEGGKRLAYGARALTRGRLAIRAQAGLSRRRADRLRRRLHQLRRASRARTTRCSPACWRPRRPMRRSPPDGRDDELAAYEAAWRGSDIGRDLHKVRNVKPLWSKLGLGLGVACGGLDMWTNELLGFSIFGTLKHGKPDCATLKPLASVKPIVYPKPDGKISFDRAVVGVPLQHQSRGGPAGPSAPARSRRSDPRQPAPLRRAGARSIARPASTKWFTPTKRGAPIRASSSTRRTASTAKPATSRIPPRISTWTPPEGGGGPNYPDM